MDKIVPYVMDFLMDVAGLKVKIAEHTEEYLCLKAHLRQANEN